MTRALVAVAVVALTLGGGACKKFEGPEEKKLAPAAVPLDAGAAAGGDVPPPEAPFAARATSTLEELVAGVRECVDDFMNKMDMKQIEDGFLPVDINRMDDTCRNPIERYKAVAQELLGQHPVLDAYLEHAAGYSDAYLRLSFRMKQLGARERWNVIEQIQKHRTEVLEHAARLYEGLEALRAWPKDQKPDTEIASGTVDLAAYETHARELVAWQRDRLPKLAEAYEKHAFQPAHLGQSIHFFSFRFAYVTASKWAEIGQRRFEALRCTGGDGCTKLRDGMAKVNAAARSVVETYKEGLDFYRGKYHDKIENAAPIRQRLAKRIKELEAAARKLDL